MARRLSFATGIITILAAVFALLLVTSIPASAHHKEGHEQGEAKASEDTATASSSEPDDNDDNRHPSGKDRETNNGTTDDEQGKSTSTPDQNGSGPERDFEGTDKAGGPGGMDKDDQDGNNGCGNDDDFEDDNEGWCGNKPKPDKTETEVDATDEEKLCPDDTTMSADDEDCAEQPTEEVEGGVIDAPSIPEANVLGLRVRGDGTDVAPAVRGERVEGGVLPFTGGDVLGFVFLALGLVAAGYLMLRSRRSI